MTHCTGRLHSLLAWLLTVACCAMAGCQPGDIDPTYGRASGPGSDAVGGLAALASMFERAGYDVTTFRRISPKIQRYDVIVWAPDKMSPPDRSVRSALDTWLVSSPGRTLIYIGRDYDPISEYWQRVLPSAPASQRREIERRRATAEAAHDARRATVSNSEYARWFTMRRQPVEEVGQLNSESPWADGIEQQKFRMRVGIQLEPPRQADLQSLDAGGLPTGVPDAEGVMEYAELLREMTVPSAEILLASPAGPLVMRVMDQQMKSAGSQILVVVNGAFLLNLPLVDRENRTLAVKLVNSVTQASTVQGATEQGMPEQGTGDSAPQVAFLESGPGDPAILRKEPSPKYPTGMEVLQVWPLGVMILHLMVLGVIGCFVLFPIFGRPREPARRTATNFSAHIKALGEMLAQTRNEQVARDRIRHYYELTGHEQASDNRTPAVCEPTVASQPPLPQPPLPQPPLPQHPTD